MQVAYHHQGRRCLHGDVPADFGRAEGGGQEAAEGDNRLDTGRLERNHLHHEEDNRLPKVEELTATQGTNSVSKLT